MKLRYALSCLLLIACSADAGEPLAPGEEIETDEAAATAMKYYDCRTTFDDGSDRLTRMEVGFSATRMTVTDISKNAAPQDTGGRIDRGYQPSPQYAGAIRYQGFSVLEDNLSSDVAHVEFIVSPQIKQREAQGKIWIRTSGSGGGSASYFCRSKPAKLSVETSRKARLACDLRLVCTDDNPPGETCLSEAFVNQTASSSATLRLAYLDHFGVFAQRRNVQLGASADLSRTTRKLSGGWGDYELKLDHRAGITYTGSIKLPDGRTSAAQCNDLAMLD
jgi:hypothetical protein